jgi:integrase/recombinase XerD
MSALHDALSQYVTVRRALGTRLAEPAVTLGHFVTFLEGEGSSRITTKLALQWAMTPEGVQPATWARRLSMVRQFAVWLSAFDSETEVPPPRLLPARRRRRRPYIFTDEEIAGLMTEAARRRSPTGLRALTYATLLGLLASTGLRPGEAPALDRSDVDLDHGLLSIRQTKFGKSRMVPVDDSTRDALRQYAEQRDALCARPQSQAFLLSERGQRVHGNTARRMFAMLSCATGLRPATGSRRWGRGPRLQDFRHTFATRRLVEWYRAGLDVRPGAAEADDVSRSCRGRPHVLVHPSRSRAPGSGDGASCQAASAGRCTMSAPSFPGLLQRFFTERLVAQRGASPHTVAGYRDTFRLLFAFATKRLGRAPSALRVEDLDVRFVEAFLDHLERDRDNRPRTRNHRLSALHAFFRYVALAEPALSLQCQRILAIPPKRFERGPEEFLTEEEITALVSAPNTDTWIGQRDRALLLVAVQTGLRNSEMTSLRRQDVELGVGAHVRCLGKGRKSRCTPLRPDVVAVLKAWLSRHPGAPGDPIFPSARGRRRLSADAMQRLVARHTATAAQSCPSLKAKTVTPHTLRHAAAMALLRRGVDLTVIALWLGHESTETTEVYLHADMRLKERALAHATTDGLVPDRYRASDPLLAFLEAL